MNRRVVLGALSGVIGATAGCLGGSGREGDTEFELVDPVYAVDDPPDVAVEGDTVRIEGTVRYASSSCGTAELVYDGYERFQRRVDVLVVAADAVDDADGCTDDLVDTGYRAVVSLPENARRVAATEHHAFGDAYSAAVGPTD